MRRYRKEEIRSRAKEVLRMCGITDAPIDPVLVANRLGIRVIPATFKEDWISGGIHKEGNVTSIYVSNSEHFNRQRFTIAHEIGHFNMHLDEIGDKGILEAVDMYRSPYSSDPDKEVEANEFAASILMPEDLLRKYWVQCRSVEFVADLFNVSRQAMQIRLSSLGLC